MMNNMVNFFRSIFSRSLSREAFDAYFYRLPENINVQWKKDGKFIIGRVQAGDNTFVTQGMDVDDFIEMVNDAVITVNNIPKQYINTLRIYKTYNPNSEQRQLLKDVNVREGKFGTKKTRTVRVA